MKHKCQNPNCGKIHNESNMIYLWPEIPDDLLQLSPGDKVPSGLCRSCNHPTKYYKPYPRARLRTVEVTIDIVADHKSEYIWEPKLHLSDFGDKETVSAAIFDLEGEGWRVDNVISIAGIAVVVFFDSPKYFTNDALNLIEHKIKAILVRGGQP